MGMEGKQDRGIILEKEQTTVRLAGILVWAIYIFYLNSQDKIQDVGSIVIFGACYLIIAALLSESASKNALSKSIRRYAGVVLDTSMTSIFMCLLPGGYGVPLFSVYLWVIIGNGFRYGSSYLIVSSVLSVTGFTIILIKNNDAPGYELYAITGYILLITIPMYVNILLNRITDEKKRAEIANREKTRFLANISHEIRTPLNAIVGFSSMLGKVSDQQQQQQMVRHINNASESLMDLVEGVLDLSRIESGKVRVCRKSVCVRELLQSIEGMFSMQARDKGVGYVGRVADTVPQYVMLDAQRTRQVLVNLIGNAVKFTASGEITVSVEAECLKSDQPMLRFTVADTGPGITEDFRSVIFERFRQVDDSARRQYGGAGLGTAIAKNLVELMGGEIGVKSRVGEGSCFWFTMPLQQGSADGGEFCAGRERLAVDPGNRMAVSRVLVAEDSNINRYVYESMLQLLGVDVVFAESGGEALELMRTGGFSLAILDLQMPGVSGLDVIGIYNRATDKASRMPIVVITGDATAEMKHECELLGVSAFLPKPVGLDRMRDLLNQYMIQGGDLAAGTR